MEKKGKKTEGKTCKKLQFKMDYAIFFFCYCLISAWIFPDKTGIEMFKQIIVSH